MKGIVFTEFIEMAEEKFGMDTVERMIAGADLPNGGAYTAVGTYEHGDMMRMVQQLSTITGLGSSTLVQAFGQHLFGRFASGYPQFFAGLSSTFAFLPHVGSHIHHEVRKLYPDAELPTLDCKLLNPECMEMIYQSSRPFADLAEGLIRGCIGHFGEKLDLKRETVNVASGSSVRFTISAIPA